MFQNLRQGATIYVMDKTEKVPVLKMGQVVNVGAPAPVYNTNPTLMTGFNAKMEMTIRASVDGAEGDFAHLPCDQGVHDYGSTVVADSQEAMLAVVDNVEREAQQRIDNRENDEKTVAACGEMKKTLNPNYAKEMARDEELKNLSGRLDGIEDSVSQILKLLNK